MVWSICGVSRGHHGLEYLRGESGHHGLEYLRGESGHHGLEYLRGESGIPWPVLYAV